jgi:DNA-binding NarL/FixJ family response regulator
MAIRVLVVDDHEVVRSGLKSLFAGTDIEIVAEASNGQEALAAIKSTKLDVVLMDVRMPEVDGLNILGRLKLDHPDLPVVVLSTYDNPTYVARAVALQAAGYVLKDAPREKLLDAIKKAATGETVWTRDELRRVPLTQRESEVLKQLALGLTNKEIANSLNISYETVKEHVQHVLRKIGVTDRTQAAVWAVRKGLV